MINALRAVAGRWPRFSFSLARALAWLSRPLGRGIPEERLAVAFPQLSQADLRAVRRETWRNFLQNEALEAALARNVFAGAGDGEAPARLAGYVRAAVETLAAVPREDFLAGRLRFPDPTPFRP